MSPTNAHTSLSSTSTHNSLSFLRVPKSGKTKMGKDKSWDKEQGKDKRKNGKSKDGEGEKEEEWYIPYKGPYEPAPATRLKKRESERSRDSWGYPVPVMENGVGDEVDSYHGDPDRLHVHAPMAAQESSEHGHGHHPQQQRSRSQSLLSPPFHSLSQNQTNQPLSLRPNYSSQSYINLDAAGGVGDSPVPPLRSVRHMQHAGYGVSGMGRPWSAAEAREAREVGGNEGVGGPRTVRQRSSLASLFEKYGLLKKLSKLGLGGSGSGSGSGVEGGGQPAEKREQPPPRPPRQRPPPWQSRPQSQSQTQHQHQHQHQIVSTSPPLLRPPSSSSRTKPELRINPPPPPSSSLSVRDDDGDDEDREPRDRKQDKCDDIIVVPRSDPELESRSVSVYSQPSPFVPLTQPKCAPVLRLTPPPVDNPVLLPLTASTMSSFLSNQRTLSSADSYSHSSSHSRSNSHSHSRSYSQHSATASASVPLGVVDEDDSHVESYYDMLITSSVNTLPLVNPIESRITGSVTNEEDRHPYAVTFPSGYIQSSSLPNGPDPFLSRRVAGKQKKRLSPIPQSRLSFATLRSIASSPDLIGRGKGADAHAQRVEGVDVSRSRPHVREKLPSTGGGGERKERWLSTNLIAIFLPKPKLKIKAKTKTNSGKEKSRSATDLVGRGTTSDVVGHVPIDMHSMTEFGVVQRQSDVQEEPRIRGSTSRRQSYAYDDLSLLSLDRVLEERDRLEKDRIKWQAQAVKSLGNKHTRIVSRSRSKSLTQVGRKLRGIPGQQQQQHGYYHHTRGQQSSIDFLAARACLGDQDVIPLVDEDNAPTAVRRPQVEFPKHNEGETHERKTSGSSGFVTCRSSSNGVSARSYLSGSDNNSHTVNGHHHKRIDSWTRAVRIAKSLPHLCGVVQDEDEEDDQNKQIQQQQQQQQQHQQQHQQQQQQQGPPSPKVTLKNDPATTRPPATLLNPISDENQRPSPSPSSNSGGCDHVGIAISTPPESQEPCRDYHHPYTIGADHGVDSSKRKNDESCGRSPPVIRLPDHPYAQGGLSLSSGGERGPDYVGPHPATAVAMTKELMANLGLSELSARHRLPPQVMLAQQQPPVSRTDSGSHILQSQSQQQQQQQQREQPQQKSSNKLYVKVDDIRNSYQDLQPYLRVDSNVRPSDRLWVTYSPGTVKEVMPNEVFEYSPHISDQDVTQVDASNSGSGSGHGSPSGSGAGADLFLQRYQRMSTVYQDTATMGQALGNAMYDSFSTQDALKRRVSIDSGIGTSEGHHQSTTTTTREPVTTTHLHAVLDPPETIVERKDTSTNTSPTPRVLFGPRLNTTTLKHTTGSVSSNLSPSRVSSPILPRSSSSTENQHPALVVFTDPFPGRRGGGAVSAASPEHSSSGTSTSPPTSPTVPRVGSPDNLEPFHGLFYHPPGGSETDSLPSHSPQLARIPASDEEEPSQLLLDDGPWVPRLRGSGMTMLMKEVSDELEQIMLDRQRKEQRGRSGSILSSNTQQSQRPSTSDSVSTSTTSKGGAGSQSRRINTEAGPLDFVLDRSMALQQDPPMTQSGYIPRPNRISMFYPATPIPEDIEFSRASSPFEGTAEDGSVRLPASTNTNDNSNQTGLTTTSYAPPRPNEEEYPSLVSYPDGTRASYLTTTDTNSRISTLSEFPVPPNGITPEEISLLAALPR